MDVPIVQKEHIEVKHCQNVELVQMLTKNLITTRFQVLPVVHHVPMVMLEIINQKMGVLMVQVYVLTIDMYKIIYIFRKYE